MNTFGVTSEIAMAALHNGFSGFSAKRQKVTTMATPIRGEVGREVEVVRNAVLDDFLILNLMVGFADALGNNFAQAFLVARQPAIGALQARSVFEKVWAEGAAHDVVKLLTDKLVTLLFLNFEFLLTNSTLTVKTLVHAPRLLLLFGCDRLLLGI